MARIQAYNTAKFGNSDPKAKALRTPMDFMPFEWDEKPSEKRAEDIISRHARNVALRRALGSEL